jgi:hypothetical protein
MIRKIIGTILVILGGLGIVILVFGGGPILPHIVGPIALVAAGTLVLTLKRKGKQPYAKE